MNLNNQELSRKIKYSNKQRKLKKKILIRRILITTTFIHAISEKVIHF